MNKIYASLLIAFSCLCAAAVPRPTFPYPEHPRSLNLPPDTLCRALVDMKNMGWGVGNKAQFCIRYKFNGNTNPTWLYRSYSDGGLCYSGPTESCQEASGARIPLKSGGACTDLVDMKTLGWTGGNKHNFCTAHGYDGNTNPTRAGYKNYSDGGLCYKGQKSACRSAAISWVQYIRSLNRGVAPGW